MICQITIFLLLLLPVVPVFSQQYTGEINATIGTISSVSAQGVWVQYGVNGATQTVVGQTNLAIFNGRVGVGTTNPSEKLEVYNGNIKSNMGVLASTHVFIPQSSTPTAQAEATIFYNSSLRKIFLSTGTGPNDWVNIADAGSNGNTLYGPVNIVGNSTSTPYLLTITTGNVPGFGSSTVMTVSTNGIVEFLGHTKVKAFVETATTIPSQTEYKIPLSSGAYDYLAEFDRTNNRWIARFPGYYYIIGQISFANITQGKSFQLRLKKNGVQIAEGSGMGGQGGSVNTSILTTNILNLVPGDYIELFTYLSQSGSSTLNPNYSYLTVFRVP